MGFDYIQPLSGGFAKDTTGNCFRLANSPVIGAPTVNIPFVGQTEATSITHHTLDRGPQGPAIETFHSDLTPPWPDAAEACPSAPPHPPWWPVYG